MSDNKPVVSQQEGYAKPKGGKFRRHCAKWWWVHLIIFILIALLVILLIIFVAIPKIAQQKINEAKLYVDGILITQTESQNYTMAINSTIEAHSPVKATISPFKGKMFLEDLQPHTAFVEIDFPETTSESNQKVNVTQFVSITDMEAFTTFNTWLLVNDSLRVTVSGKTQVQVKGISKKFDVDFTKTVTMPGLRNFDGTTVSDTTISLKADKNGDNFKGLVNIPNYSIVNFEIGNASFHNYLLGKEIGTVFIDNMILRPGLVNNFTMHANISQAPVLTAMGEKPYCQTGKLPFQLRGKTVFNHGQPLSYYADSLATSNQSVEIDIATPLKKDLSLTIPCS